MVVPSFKEVIKEEGHPIPHEAEFCPDPLGGASPDFRLALGKLEEIQWGEKNGYQVCDPAIFVERYGAPTVLYAIWCAKGRDIRNPAGFVTWWCQQGKQAPEGWQHPELRQPAPEPLLPPAPTLPGKPEAVPELPVTPIELQPVFDWIRERVRPQSWNVWFAPASMTIGPDDEVCFWTNNHVAAEWIEANYTRLIQRAFRETLGREPEVRFQVAAGRETKHRPA